MRSTKFDLSVIIINYNSYEFTRECVKSVLKNTTSTVSYEIIIVDNASKKEDYAELKNYISGLKYSNVRLYRSRINTGFGGGNMYAVQFANSKYYLFLNNDTLLINDPIKICFDFMEKTKDAALCGPQIFNEHQIKEVSFDHFTSLGREIFGKKMLEFIFPGTKPNRRKLYTKPLSVDYVNGSFMFFRAKDFDSVGGFDTNIFLYFEESDICYRLKKKSKKTYFIPSASYLHYQGKSIGNTSWNIKTKIELKTSMFYVIRKNYGYLHYQILRIFFIFRYGVVSIIKPKYFRLFHRILIGLPLGKSLKHEQRII
ncbi:glycosyltransferase family 2 protein [Eudoraea adriatica]|uniref:glycosyltransferase family 2 protein n=1 Tax=Eudoraea adriatica TaxID=446681 RepID=UPI000376B329|nr:glycosyltransferase family 2 protein [Eudoraea adriatica]